MRVLLISIGLMLTLSYSLSAQKTDTIASKKIDSLINVSRGLLDKRNYSQAMENCELAEKLALATFTRESAEYGLCCHNHARTLELGGQDKKEAEKWYLDAISIRAKVLGKNHYDYGASILNLGSLYGQAGDLQRAEPLILEAKNVFEKSVGKESPSYAQCLNNLGIISLETKKYENAEAYYLEAKRINEKTKGKNTIQYCGNLVNLGKLYFNMTYYEKAESNLLEAKEIFEVQLKNTDHFFYTNCITMLSLMYAAIGKYGLAEPLLIQNGQKIEKALGKNNDNYAANLNNLAQLYSDMGIYEKSEASYLEALAIKEKNVGKNNESYYSTLNNLAVLYGANQKYDQAKKPLLETKALIEADNKTGSDIYSNCLINLGNVYEKLDQFDKAEELFLKALEIEEKNGNVHDNNTSVTLNNLGNIYMAKSELSKATEYYSKAKDLIENKMGKKNHEYTMYLSNLALVYSQKGELAKAEPYFNELQLLDEEIITNSITHLSENELQQYLNTFVGKQNYLYSYAEKLKTDQGYSAELKNNVAALCYNNSLFYKGFLLNVANKSRRIVNTDSTSAEKFNRMNAYMRLLSSEYSKPIVSQNKEQIKSLEEKTNELEKQIASIHGKYKELTRPVKFAEVQKKLKKEEAAIEFIQYNSWDKAKQPVYAALIITSDQKEARFVPLFKESAIDSLINTKNDKKADYVNGLYTAKDRGAFVSENEKQSLYDVIWKPIETELSNIKVIYFSNAGLLHRINIGAIPISDAETLADKYQMFELNSTRQLAEVDEQKTLQNTAMLFGGIKFDKDSIIQKAEPIYASRSRGSLSFESTDSALRGGSWSFLLGTEKEVNSIEQIVKTSGFNTSVLKGYNATEDSFKSLEVNASENKLSPRVIHIATHGYFFPDPKITKETASNSLQTQSVFKTSDHPLLRSGLIMAGGNEAWQGKSGNSQSEDGVLTAYEISQMNLSNTELVVLSACETGLGDIQGNEGVYGLQRAFKLAGVKYLIMSLWQVPDKQTSLLMTTFYKKWLETEGPDGSGKMTIPNAFSAAQKELRENGFDPYYWAGFVLIN